MAIARSDPLVHVVDGYNLALGSAAFGMARDRGGLRGLRDAVFQAMARDCERRGERAVVVWDGADVDGVPARLERHGAAERFSRPPEQADERVIVVALQLRESSDHPVVVSDDRQHVRAAAERVGLDWITCEEYEERLSTPLPGDPFATNAGRHARRALTRLVAAGLVEEPGAGGDALVADLATALAYSEVASRRPHKMAKAVVRWLREYGITVRGGPHEHRALLVSLWDG